MAVQRADGGAAVVPVNDVAGMAGVSKRQQAKQRANLTKGIGTRIHL